MPSPRIHLNPSARTWVFHDHNHHHHSESAARVLAFHRSLPEYAETPLRALPATLARELGLGRVLLKDESDRFGLPAFKILGASWAVYRAVGAHLGLGEGEGRSISTSISIADLGARARAAGVSVVTATEGNCGRAVARVAAGHLGIPVRVHVPRYMDAATREKIRGEGEGGGGGARGQVEVLEVDGSYDDTIPVIQKEAREGKNVVLVLDVGVGDYQTVPSYFVEGYSTMLSESERQVRESTTPAGKAATHAVVPCGAGSIAQAVTEHFKSSSSRPERLGLGLGLGRQPAAAACVIAVEPTSAACLQESLRAGASVSVPTAGTICRGMNCGTLSTTAWPALREGVDACVAVGDGEVHRAVRELQAEGVGISAGPCGAATLAALRRLCGDAEARGALGLDGEAVVVLYCTEGAREYEVPT